MRNAQPTTLGEVLQRKPQHYYQRDAFFVFPSSRERHTGAR
jgi:hypothetical protein